MEEDEHSDSPLLAQLLVLKMDDIMDKLKLLNYEKKFCKALKFKPFPKYEIIFYLSYPMKY